MANLLTLFRILLILPFAAMFFLNASWALVAALAIFAVAAATDFIDGAVARARRETSALGAALDPLADKLLVAAALLLLVRNGVIRDADFVAALAILLREVLVGGLREAVDRDDAAGLYRALEEEIVPCFYRRGPSGLPEEWIGRMKSAIALLAPRFSAARMMQEYFDKLYLPASRREGWGSEMDEVKAWSP